MRLTCLLLLSLALTVRSASLTDVTGRVVEIEKPATRVLLGEGRFLSAIALLERDDPAAKIAGMLGDFPLVDPDGYRHFVTAFPAVAKVPTFGRITEDTVSVESMVALQPEVAVFGLGGHGPAAHSKETVEKLTAAGVKVVFIDFRSDPLVNTPKSMRLLGQIFGREAEADEFVRFYETELERVASRLKDVKHKPAVFIENRVGLSDDCCGTMAHGMMGRFIDFAGGDNIANALIPGEFGTLSLEHLLAVQPEIYIGTAIGSKATAAGQTMRIHLGAEADENTARESLRHALTRTGIDQLTAVKNGRAHAIWHHYYNSPLNVVAVQVFAKWLHPELFADLRPEETLKTLHTRFQKLPQAGVFWISLTP